MSRAINTLWSVNPSVNENKNSARRGWETAPGKGWNYNVRFPNLLLVTRLDKNNCGGLTLDLNIQKPMEERYVGF